jgi:hypothetical protein
MILIAISKQPILQPWELLKAKEVKHVVICESFRERLAYKDRYAWSV